MACTTSWNATASGMLSTVPDEGTHTVKGDGPADLDPGRLIAVGGDIETADPSFQKKVKKEKAKTHQNKTNKNNCV